MRDRRHVSWFGFVRWTGARYRHLGCHAESRRPRRCETCTADRNRLCSDVLPGGGRIVRCLAAKLDQLTPACRAGMEQARDALRAAGLVPQGTAPSQ